MVTGCVSVGKLGESEVFRINQTSFIPLKGPQTLEEERVTELRKLFNSGTFYFLWSSSDEPNDVTLCSQKHQQNPGTDNRFFWNRYVYLFQKTTIKWCLSLTFVQASTSTIATLWN